MKMRAKVIGADFVNQKLWRTGFFGVGRVGGISACKDAFLPSSSVKGRSSLLDESRDMAAIFGRRLCEKVSSGD